MRNATLLLLGLTACGPTAGDGRQAELVAVLTRADAVLLRTRPALMAGKYAVMAAGPYSYLRGEMAVERHDWELGRSSSSRYHASGPFVRSVSDPHPENFGLLVASDQTAALEPNDLDSSDRAPWLFEVRRLLSGLALAARLANPSVDAHQVARAAAVAYAEQVTALQAGAAAARLDSPGESAVLADLFKRSARDLAARSELTDFTVVQNQARRFIRGTPDPASPEDVVTDLPEATLAGLREVTARLGHDPRFALLDAVRIFGSGVASFPRVRARLLLRGASDGPEDDVMLEVKELGESPLAGWYGPALTERDAPSRVETSAHLLWARPDADPLFFGAQWVGLPVLVRSELGANKGIKVSRLTGTRASQDELDKLGRVLGALLARLHAVETPARTAIASQLAQPDAFADEQADFAVGRAQTLVDDFALFQDALARLGPTLGLVATSDTLPGADARTLFGSP